MLHPINAMSFRRALVIVSLLATASCIDDGPVSGPLDDDTPQVAQPQLTSVSIRPTTSTTLFLGSTSQLVVTALDQYGNPFRTAATSWESSAPSTVAVDQSGNVTGLTVGSATIQATSAADGITVVTLTPMIVSSDTPALTTLTISAPQTTVALGATSQLTASVLDQYNRGFPATVVWSSSNPAAATIDPASGTVEGLAAGTTTITASATAGEATLTRNIVLTVAPPQLLTQVVITPPEPHSVIIGQGLQLTASPRDAANHPVTAQITWITSDASIARVSNTGFVTSVAPGNVYISATASTPNAIVTGSTLVTITPPFPTTASVIATSDAFLPATVDIARGGTVSWSFANMSDVVFSTSTPGAPQNISASVGGPITRTFNTAGTFTYTSNINPGATGTVIVH